MGIIGHIVLSILHPVDQLYWYVGNKRQSFVRNVAGWSLQFRTLPSSCWRNHQNWVCTTPREVSTDSDAGKGRRCGEVCHWIPFVHCFRLIWQWCGLDEMGDVETNLWSEPSFSSDNRRKCKHFYLAYAVMLHWHVKVLTIQGELQQVEECFSRNRWFV